MKRIVVYIFLLTATILVNNLFAQISAPTSSHTTFTEYSSGNQDPIFCFDNTVISLEAKHSSGFGTTFNWFEFNTTTNRWDIPVGYNANLSVKEEGGYQVVVSDGTTSEIYQCWAFVPGTTGTLGITTDSVKCDNQRFKVTNIKELYYTDVNANNTRRGVPYEIQWMSVDNFNDTISSPTGEADFKMYYTRDVEAIVGGLGMDEIIAQPLINILGTAVEAKFTQEIMDNLNLNVITPRENSAKVKVEFKAFNRDSLSELSKGENLRFEWEFGYTDNAIGIEPPASVGPNTDHYFTMEGTFKNRLTVENRISGCQHSWSHPTTIVVSKTEVGIPNVFTPNGDGKNDEFKVWYSSVKEFNMIIVNRWGRTVYKSTDPNKGWDGRIGGSSAAPGVYYYDVTWTGFDGVSGHKKGFLHLITGRR